MSLRYSVILGFLGQLSDRFAAYHEPHTFEEKLALAGQIDGVTGVEPVSPPDFRDVSVETFKRLLDENELAVSSVNVNVKSEPKFHRGALTSSDAGVRAEAVGYLKRGMELASALDADLVTVCPLSDGHDYPFQIDYQRAWHRLIDSLGEAADYRPEVKLSVEYKQSEPRAKVIVPNVGVTLHLCDQIGLPNVGVTVDTGHALYAGEPPAQAIAWAADADRLFLVHINDNYRNWDWDLMPGTVNFWDWLETLFVLDEVGYDGWIVSDVFPARTDPVDTLSTCYHILERSEQLLDKIGRERLRTLIRAGDVLQTVEILQAMGE